MIEWKDKRGRRNVLILEPLDFGPPPRPIPPHDFEPHRYSNGKGVVVSEVCSWEGAKADHPIHQSPSATSSPAKTASGSAANRKPRKDDARSR